MESTGSDPSSKGSPTWTAESRAGDPDAATYDNRADLTDSEWELDQSLIRPSKRCRGKRTVAIREVVNGSFAMPNLGTGTSSFPRYVLLGFEYLGPRY